MNVLGAMIQGLKTRNTAMGVESGQFLERLHQISNFVTRLNLFALPFMGNIFCGRCCAVETAQFLFVPRDS